MTSQLAKVALVCPSLNLCRAQDTLVKAEHTAGVPVELIASHDKHGEGFTKAVNRGWRAALDVDDVTHLTVINDDTHPDRIETGWLRRLVEALESHTNFGVCGPSGPCRTDPQKSGKPGMPKRVVGVQPYSLAFFMVVMKRQVMDDVGLLDENYIHYGSDNDWCHRAAKAGWRVVWVQDVYMPHDVGSIKHEWRAHDRSLYLNKWG